MTKTENVIIRINEETKKEFVKKCGERQETQTQVLLRAIKNYLKRRKK